MSKKKLNLSQRELRARQEFERAYDLFETGNLSKAKRAYEFAARLGSPHAQIVLADLYDEGAFGRRYRKKAIALYKRAIKHGLPEAANNLAQLYRLENNERWYIFWLSKAAMMGHSDARAEYRALGKK